jgi:hypothetical protein
MVHDVIVMQRIGSSVGEHRVEQFNLFDGGRLAGVGLSLLTTMACTRPSARHS